MPSLKNSLIKSSFKLNVFVLHYQDSRLLLQNSKVHMNVMGFSNCVLDLIIWYSDKRMTELGKTEMCLLVHDIETNPIFFINFYFNFFFAYLYLKKKNNGIQPGNCYQLTERQNRERQNNT